MECKSTRRNIENISWLCCWKLIRKNLITNILTHTQGSSAGYPSGIGARKKLTEKISANQIIATLAGDSRVGLADNSQLIVSINCGGHRGVGAQIVLSVQRTDNVKTGRKSPAEFLRDVYFRANIANVTLRESYQPSDKCLSPNMNSLPDSDKNFSLLRQMRNLRLLSHGSSFIRKN